MIEIWEHALESVRTSNNAVLVIVADHSGSVPGTTGASMVVTDDSVVGTVGGGVAEHEMIERARSLESGTDLVDMEHTPEGSGSLCSGHHTMAMVALRSTDQPVLESIVSTLAKHRVGTLRISSSGVEFTAGSSALTAFETAARGWSFSTTLGFSETLTIVGGGHCALALSRVMSTLPFRVAVVDDRDELPTMAANSFAHRLQVVPYDRLAEHVPDGEHSWVVVMTFGHTHDETVLRALEGKELRYLGLLGSEAKVRQMFDRMKANGVSADYLESISAPVGVSIGSHTPEEIAVSIAAEIIQLTNQ
jgi:xanthine dehydrogenase accessory factor